MISQLRQVIGRVAVVMFVLLSIINIGSFEFPPIPGGTLKIESVQGTSEPAIVDRLNYLTFYVLVGLIILAILEVRGKHGD